MYKSIDSTTMRDYSSLAARFNPKAKDVDSDLIDAYSDEGRAYAADVVKGRWAAMIATGPEVHKINQFMHFIDEIALGKLFLVEEENNPLVKRLTELSDKIIHVQCNLANRPTIVTDVCDALYDAVNAEKRRVGAENINRQGNEPEFNGILSGIFTLWDDSVCLASRVQQAFHLFGDDPHVVDICHDKLLGRQMLEAAGIKGPAHRKLKTQEDAVMLGNELRYPVILKPINGAASIGIYQIESYEELVQKFSQCQEDLIEIYKGDELMGLTFEDSPKGAAQNADDLAIFIAEEFIGGREFDCDVAIYDGELCYGNINDDWDFKEGWMCERGQSHPASLTQEDYDQLYHAAYECARIIGCRRGVYHVEMKWDPVLGPQLIEVNPRMGGCAVWQLHRNSWGADLLQMVCYAFLNIPVRPRTLPLSECRGKSVSHILFSDKGGVIREDMQAYNEERLYKEFQSIEDGGIIDYVCLNPKKGDFINGWLGTEYPSHIGRLDLFFPIDKYPDLDAADVLARSLRRHVIVPLESGDHFDEV